MNRISESHLDTIVHAVASQLSTLGITLDSDILSDLNQNLDDFFVDECEIEIEDTLTFDMLSFAQQAIWNKRAKEESVNVTDLYSKNSGVLPEKKPVIKQVAPTDKQKTAPVKDLSFKLIDETENKQTDLSGHIDNSGNLGLSIKFDGYGDYSSQDGHGTPIYIEAYDGKLRALIYSDINQCDPTHVINFDAAKESNRQAEIEYERAIG
jgi:hypothetical protein